MVRRWMHFERHTKLVSNIPMMIVNLRTTGAACLMLGVILLVGAAHGTEYKLLQTVYPGNYAPDPLVVKKGERVRILATSKGNFLDSSKSF